MAIKTEKVKVPSFRQVKVKNGFKEVEKYTASDGREFWKKSEAEHYENQLEINNKWNQVKHIDLFNVDFPDHIQDWYYFETDEQIEIFINKYNFKNRVQRFNDKSITKKSFDYKTLKDMWLGVYVEDDGDYPEIINIYTKDYFLNMIDSYFHTIDINLYIGGR